MVHNVDSCQRKQDYPIAIIFEPDKIAPIVPIENIYYENI